MKHHLCEVTKVVIYLKDFSGEKKYFKYQDLFLKLLTQIRKSRKVSLYLQEVNDGVLMN